MKTEKEYYLGEHSCGLACPCNYYKNTLEIEWANKNMPKWKAELNKMISLNEKEIVPHYYHLDKDGNCLFGVYSNWPTRNMLALSKENIEKWNAMDISEKKYFDGTSAKPMSEYVFVEGYGKVYDNEYFLGEHECDFGCHCDSIRHPENYIDIKSELLGILEAFSKANEKETVPYWQYLNADGKYDFALAEEIKIRLSVKTPTDDAIEWNNKDIYEKKYFDGREAKPMTEFVYTKRVTDEDIEKMLEEL
ncbi:TPA: hypothetical protein SLO92_002666 [Klebsiella pneumoniae]|uniref:hypothetical protein n=1 Tax=Klebsiella pneumoniae TaxID=573 RepID=UPI001495EE01|nr:hypothetical protein [Klebsiella pneumoniae]MBG2014209.1 hypothetical protein [Klebsiella pneumoniae]HBR1451417.1 hypothetical protein [Klebsiella pneumoniae]HDU2808001.1 hypothetical protein [Klebsiella pneumoniae]HEI9839959.1 hypothetical protein [Klebsiella pneumoniae]HEJ0272609.1 hypothetical protein [Klebsiella pneumoniae]